MATRLRDLNSDLLGLVFSFLYLEDQQCISSADKLLHESSRLHRYIRLNNEYSMRYKEDAAFKSRCDSLVESGSKQLEVSFYDVDIATLATLGDVHTLKLKLC
jgi:hypothetical protein